MQYWSHPTLPKIPPFNRSSRFNYSDAIPRKTVSFATSPWELWHCFNEPNEKWNKKTVRSLKLKATNKHKLKPGAYRSTLVTCFVYPLPHPQLVSSTTFGHIFFHCFTIPFLWSHCAFTSIILRGIKYKLFASSQLTYEVFDSSHLSKHMHRTLIFFF